MSVNSSHNVCTPSGDYFLSQNPPDVTIYPEVRAVFISFYALTFILGICGNAFVIYAIASHTRLQTVRNFFIASLSASDCCVCLISLPITAYVLLFKEWNFGWVACRTIPLLQGMTVIISTFTLTSIAIDRFILVVFPTKTPISKNQSIAIVCLIWITASTIGIPMTLNYRLLPGSIMDTPICGHYCMEFWENNARGKKIYGWFVLFLQFILPLSLICVCYSLILRTVNTGQKVRNARLAVRAAKARMRISTGGSVSQSVKVSRNDQLRASITRDLEVMKRTKRTNLMLIGMVIAFALSWFFQVLMNILEDTKSMASDSVLKQHKWLFKTIAHCLAMTSTCWNPILYGYLNETFRAAFVLLLPKKLLFWRKDAEQLRAEDFNLRDYLKTSHVVQLAIAVHNDENPYTLAPASDEKL